MPYKSQAQAGYFHTHPELQKYTAEFDAASRGKRLPRRVKRQRRKVRRSA